MTFKQTLLLAILLLFVAVSCKSAAPILPSDTNTVKTITVTKIVRDTIVKTVEDATYYKAWLKCQDGQVIIEKQETSKPNKEGLQPPNLTLDNNILEVDCRKKAEELFFQWQEKFKQEVIQTEIRTPYPVERNLTFFQTLFIWCGKLFLVIILLAAIGFILKTKKIL